ncbi:MAG: dephospho-CoA kinase [Solirubrobacterales bacterium]|nr:dephospho-CoA kinase [Solirubrobacterales bacterium]MCB8969826.1 dephospho-CoA kinase [Thermoleophilales bacterium]
MGLTGGIAAGKSEALRILAELGAETISTDAVVHELLGSDEVRARLVERWGDRVAPDGEVDRGAVGEIVFEYPDELAWLESVLHPLVGERVVGWRRGLSQDVEVAVVEVPLLFEGSMAEMFDATIAISAGDGERRRRADARGTGALEARSGRQLSQEEKSALATHAITNDGTVEELQAELTALYPILREAGR